MNHPAEKVGRTLGLSVGAGRLNLKNTFPLERHILTRTPQPTSQKGCTRIRDSPVLNAQHSSCSQPQLFGERESQTDNSHSQLRQTFWCDVCVCVCTYVSVHKSNDVVANASTSRSFIHASDAKDLLRQHTEMRRCTPRLVRH